MSLVTQSLPNLPDLQIDLDDSDSEESDSEDVPVGQDLCKDQLGCMRPSGFVRTEAAFALWEMLTQDKKVDEAREIAIRLARDFPDNQELQRFIQKGQRAEGKGQR